MFGKVSFFRFFNRKKNHKYFFFTFVMNFKNFLGYHHAQFGWIHTLKDKDHLDPGSSEFAILLVIYLPRRGLLEIWSPEQKSRVAHFPVSKRGALITTNNSVLDMKQGSPLRYGFMIFCQAFIAFKIDC